LISLEAAYDNARCRYLEIPNVGIPKVDMGRLLSFCALINMPCLIATLCRDSYLAGYLPRIAAYYSHDAQKASRIRSRPSTPQGYLSERPPWYDAGRRTLSQLIQRTIPSCMLVLYHLHVSRFVYTGRYTRPSDYTTALMAWVTEYEKPTASITRSERQSVDAAVRELFTPEQLKAIEADSKSTVIIQRYRPLTRAILSSLWNREEMIPLKVVPDTQQQSKKMTRTRK
jgi:hypothetical protein